MFKEYAFRLLFSLIAFGVLAAYLLGPRDIAERFDTMALGLLGLAALPWLGALVEEFKVGGVEAKLRAVREEVAEAADAASEAREVAEEMIIARVPSEDVTAPFAPSPVPDFGPAPAPAPAPASAPTPAPDPAGSDAGEDSWGLDATDGDREPNDPVPGNWSDAPDPFLAPPAAKPAPPPAAETPLDLLEKLAKRYVAKRDSMSSGALRTAAMTSIFGDMQRAAMTVGGDDTEVLTWLHSKDAGRQLGVIAWLREFPAMAAPATYIDLIKRANQPFVQYWGLRALSGRIDALGIEEFSLADRIELKEFESLLAAGTDRQVQVRRINRKLAGAR